MSAEPSPPVGTSHRARRSVRNVVMAVIAAVPIAACSDESDDPTAANTETSVVSTTAPPEAGRGTSSFAGGESVPVSFTLPASWEVNDVFVTKPGSDSNITVSFWDVANIFSDPCQWVLVDPPVGPTVNDLVSAFANVPGLDATAATDVTVDRYEGKQFDLTVPDFAENECQAGLFALWQEDGHVGPRPNRWVEPNEHLEIWVLDVDGTRLVISAGYFPDTSAQDRLELNEILNSIQIG